MQATLRSPTPDAAWEAQAPLRDLLDCLATETGELAQCADRLQDLFGQLMGQPPVVPSDALEQAQALDGLVQRLDGLKAFLGGLSTRPLADLPGDAAQIAGALRLTSQAHRFTRGALLANDELDAGDCDLF